MRSIPLLTLGVAFVSSIALGRFCRSPGVLNRAEIPLTHASSGVSSVNEPANGVHSFKAVAAVPGSDYHRTIRLAGAAAKLDREEVLAALEQEQARENGSVDQRAESIQEALLARYAELDPRAATLWLLQTYPHQLRDVWMKVTLSTWVSRDQEAALAWASGLPARDLRASVYNALLEELGGLDPAAAERLVVTLGNNADNLDALYQKLAEKDLPSAVAHAVKLRSTNAASAIRGVMKVWVIRDLAGASAWANQMPAGDLREAAWSSLYQEWIDHDPASAAAYLSENGGADLREQSRNVASVWVERDPQAALRWSESLPYAPRKDALASAISNWAERDPRAAAEYALSQMGSNQNDLVTSVMWAWSKADLPTALGWAETLPSGGLRDDARRSVYQDWATNDPHACLDHLGGQPADQTTSEAIRTCVTQWADCAPEDVWQWSRNLPDPARRDEAGSIALDKIAEGDPAKASTMLGELAEESQPQLATKVASAWADIDLPAAQQWATALPPGEARDNAWNAMVGSWSQYDAAAATAWVEGQPPDSARDNGVAALLNSDSQVKPEEAVKLTALVVDENVRANALHTYAWRWLIKDHAAATAWVEQAPQFSPEVRAELLGAPGQSEGGTEP